MGLVLGTLTASRRRTPFSNARSVQVWILLATVHVAVLRGCLALEVRPVPRRRADQASESTKPRTVVQLLVWVGTVASCRGWALVTRSLWGWRGRYPATWGRYRGRKAHSQWRPEAVTDCGP